MILGLILTIQLLSCILASVTVLVYLVQSFKLKATALYLFAMALSLFDGWIFLHLIGNYMQIQIFYQVGAALGYLALLFLSFSVTHIHSESLLTVENAVGIGLLSSAITHLMAMPSGYTGFVNETGDYVIISFETIMMFLQLVLIVYFGLIYSKAMLNLMKLTKGTRHFKYAHLLLLSGIVGFFGVSIATALMRLITTEETQLIISRMIFLYMFPVIWFISLAVTLYLDPDLFWISPIPVYRLLVISNNGTLLFKYHFQESLKTDDELISSAISGITSLTREITETEEPLQHIILTDRTITLYSRENLSFILISNKASKTLVKSLSNYANTFLEENKELLKNQCISLHKINPCIDRLRKYFPNIILKNKEE